MSSINKYLDIKVDEYNMYFSNKHIINIYLSRSYFKSIGFNLDKLQFNKIKKLYRIIDKELNKFNFYNLNHNLANYSNIDSLIKETDDFYLKRNNMSLLFKKLLNDLEFIFKYQDLNKKETEQLIKYINSYLDKLK